ncbi:MAG: hypothetical protein LQ350_005307 [Teloschistes chrysophthalmus]|nr:MAG: hypothetical protein LQ350_005307 [Niorma chrysophthalma]
MPAYHSIFLQDTDVRLIGTIPIPHPSSPHPFLLLPKLSPNPPTLTPILPTTANFPLPPLRTRTRGPAYTLPPLPPTTPSHESPDPDSESYDAIDEILSLYRANTFFRNFEIKGPADRLLIYGILCVGELLGKVPRGGGAREGEKALLNAALDHFAIPGDASFPLNQAFEAPRDRQDAEVLRQYLSQVRQELAIRLLARLYAGGSQMPSKWWLSFTKRKFMGKTL